MNMGCTSVVMPGQGHLRSRQGPDAGHPDRRSRQPALLNPKTPFKTVKEIIDYAKANPGKLTYASSGVGGSYHLWGAQFAYMAGIDMLHVPFRGGPPAIAEIIAGRVDMMFGNLVEVLPYIKSGAVRPIAFTSVPPSPVIPGLPTIAQTLPNYRADNWFGIGAPAGTPPEIVNRLNTEVNKIIKTPEFREKLCPWASSPWAAASRT